MYTALIIRQPDRTATYQRRTVMLQRNYRHPRRMTAQDDLLRPLACGYRVGMVLQTLLEKTDNISTKEAVSYAIVEVMVLPK